MVFTKIVILGNTLTLIGTSQCFFYLEVSSFIQKMAYMFENHDELVKNNQLKMVYRRFNTIAPEYREPMLYEWTV